MEDALAVIVPVLLAEIGVLLTIYVSLRKLITALDAHATSLLNMTTYLETSIRNHMQRELRLVASRAQALGAEVKDVVRGAGHDRHRE